MLPLARSARDISNQEFDYVPIFLNSIFTRSVSVEILVVHLVGFADIGEVEASCAIGRVGRDARHAALVALPAVRRVALVPDVDRDVLSLRKTSSQHRPTAGAQ